MELKGKKIVVVGLGKTGIALARFLTGKEAVVTVTDSGSIAQLAPALTELADLSVRLELGGHSAETLEGADLIVLSPGVPHTLPIFSQARRKGIAVIGEIELAARFIEKPIIAVTRTNGKTTTTSLIAMMLERSGFSVFVGGNIGNPLVGYLEEEKRRDFLVVEVSSFQLDTIETFRPKVAVLLNIEADHLDRYDGFEGYVRSKGRIFANQGQGDIAVLNGRDAAVRSLAQALPCGRLFFCGRKEGEEGADIETDRLRIFFADKAEGTAEISGTRMVGAHNRENISAAAVASLAVGSTLAAVKSTASAFAGLPHRISFSGKVSGVRFYNDSKATNVDAVKRALESFEGGVVLIMGGRDKGGSYAPLAEAVKKRVKTLVLLGEAAKNIEDSLGAHVRTLAVRTMEEAVSTAFGQTEKGDVVLLSPGCSSFDLYSNYKERGDAFRDSVRTLRDSLI